jgi:hydrogenase maturation protein HypF
MNDLIGAKIHITGIVQGVGFRPFVYGLAQRFALVGWVRNTSAGVEIEIDAQPGALESFLEALRSETPSLAQIDSLQVELCQPNGFTSFQIIESQPTPDAFQPISPDVSICDDCRNELFDPNDRRYHYPFINCTNCGPRFTIIQDIPYDRPKTTMGPFRMCPQCAEEYHDPLDRRFHAQPVACPVCGPQVWLETRTSGDLEEFYPIGKPADQPDDSVTTVQETQQILAAGKVVAIKGLGGFHLACDALNPEAVSVLRQRKLRVDKPFALMMPNLETVAAHCLLDESERRLLTSRERPILILHRKPGSPIPPGVAPGQNTLGVMLPYTPLHYMLFANLSTAPTAQDIPSVLVMTSGNLSEEPIATDNIDARVRLKALADAFLMHNRPINTRCDDSVMRVFHFPGLKDNRAPDRSALKDETYPLRRSRGYAPYPVRLPWRNPPLLAAGAELKNAFCLTRQEYAFMSHHVGDMENYETMRAFEDGIQHFERLFRVQPQALAYDLHPDYLATRYALERAERHDLPAIGVQHHHAHIAACMAEHGVPAGEPVIGLAFDGTGYGEDGAIWGGEFLIADYQAYQRPFHLCYAPLPGGDLAIRQPWRMALSWLALSGIPWDDDIIPVKALQDRDPNHQKQLQALRHQIQTGLKAPLTSSMGRLFDAVAALIGVRQQVNYEAQAAIELESLVDTAEETFYPIAIPEVTFGSEGASQTIDPTTIFQAIIQDLAQKVPPGLIAARFHNSLAIMSMQICERIRRSASINKVVLSGGVWQNIKLLETTIAHLVAGGFQVYIHRQVPANDGGLALGQAAIAAQKLLTM